MKIKNLLFAFIFGITTLTSCQSGIVWDEVPESVYSNLELAGAMVRNRPRELFVKYGKSTIMTEKGNGWKIISLVLLWMLSRTVLNILTIPEHR